MHVPPTPTEREHKTVSLLYPPPPPQYPEFLARSLFPSPLLCAGDTGRQEVHGVVRENAPSYTLNNAIASPPVTPASPHHAQLPPEEDPLGPLPENWEMAYTENGEVYFIE